jgi:hypothetical protein
VSYGRSDHRFGFALIEPAPARFTAIFRDSAGNTLFACKLKPGKVACN